MGRRELIEQYFTNAYDFAKAGQYEDAIKAMEACIGLTGGYNSLLCTDLATFYRLSGDFPSAFAAYTKVLEYDPSHGFAWFGLGQCYVFDKGPNTPQRFECAILCFENAIKFAPEKVACEYLPLAERLLEKCRRKLNQPQVDLPEETDIDRLAEGVRALRIEPRGMS